MDAAARGIVSDGRSKLMIYQCACGGTDFELHQSGEVECCDCEHIIKGIDVLFVEGIPVENDEGHRD